MATTEQAPTQGAGIPLPMNEGIRALWAQDLLIYRQTGGHLRKDGGYCCLGVLFDQGAKAGVLEWEPDNDREEELLSDAAQAWCGLRSKDPVIAITPEGREIEASIANDEFKWDFPTIRLAILGQLPMSVLTAIDDGDR